MQRPRLALGAVIGVFAFAATASAQAQEVSLDQYRATVPQAKYLQLLKGGMDVVAARDLAGGRAEIDLVHWAGRCSTRSGSAQGLTLCTPRAEVSAGGG